MKFKNVVGLLFVGFLTLLNAYLGLSTTNLWSHELSNFTCKNGFIGPNDNLYLLGTNVSNLAGYCLKYAPNGSLLQSVSLSNDTMIDYKSTAFTILNNGSIVGKEAVLTYTTPISTHLNLSYYDASFKLNHYTIIDPKQIAPDFDILPDIHIEPNGDIYLLLTQFQSNTLTNLKFVRLFSNLTVAWITDYQYHMEMYDGSDKAQISSIYDGIVYYTVNNVLFKINAETGQIQWSYLSDTDIFGIAAFEDRVIILKLANSDEKQIPELVCLNLDHKIIWSYTGDEDTLSLEWIQLDSGKDLVGFYQMFYGSSDEGLKHKTYYSIIDKNGNKIDEYMNLADSFDERSLCYMLDNGDFYAIEPDLTEMKVTVAFYDVSYPQRMVSTGLIVLIIIASLSALSVLGYLVKKRF